MRCTFGMLLAAGLTWAAHGADPTIDSPEEAKKVAVASLRGMYETLLARADARLAAAEKAAKAKGYTKAVLKEISAAKADRVAAKERVEKTLTEECLLIKKVGGPSPRAAIVPNTHKVTADGVLAVRWATRMVLPLSIDGTGPLGRMTTTVDSPEVYYFVQGLTKDDLETPRYKVEGAKGKVAFRGCFYHTGDRVFDGQGYQVLIPLNVAVADVTGE